MRKLQSQDGGGFLSQSVSLQPITSSGATYSLRAKSREEVDAASHGEDDGWGPNMVTENHPKVGLDQIVFFIKHQIRFINTAVFPEITQFVIVAVDDDR